MIIGRSSFAIITCLVVVVFTVRCRPATEGTKITFRIHHARGYRVYLQPVAFAGEGQRILDSAIVSKSDETIHFAVAAQEQRPFKLRVKGLPMDIFFINDAHEIAIEANVFRPREFSVSNSPATASLKHFFDVQNKMAARIKEQFGTADSSNRALTNEKLDEFFHQYVNYADTVSSPGALLYVYNSVDFGKDYAGLKKFILKAAARFPSHTAIQHLKNETLDYLKTFEIEYKVGDFLPELQLPNEKGQQVSIASLKGRYVFMDFWSTWCNACLKYDAFKARARKKFSPEKFEIVSIALDSEKDAWKGYIEGNKFNWLQLIDEKMWRGPTVKTYRIDSIPFNFLLNPEGRIISKAIKPDSLLPALSRVVK